MGDRTALAYSFADICSQAAIPVMEVYRSDFTPQQKADRSPVTEADRRAETVILKHLATACPDIPVLAEEQFAAGIQPKISDRFLLVDPVDGTREFIAKNGEFTLNIALIENGIPIAGCVYAPATRQIYIGGENALVASIEPGRRVPQQQFSPIATRKSCPETGPVAMISRSHLDARTQDFISKNRVSGTIPAGSSLKFCRIAEGHADLYPRFGPTMEWDTGAGHAVLNAAGGAVTQPDGSPFAYGKVDDRYLNGDFIAWAVPPASQ